MITSDVGPWGITPRAMILDMEGDTTAGLTYALLSSYADRQTDDGWKISRKQLADDLGVSLSTMKRALRKLEDKGWIRSIGTITAEGDQGWNRYVVFTTRGGVADEPTGGGERTDRGSPESLVLRPLEQTPRTDPTSSRDVDFEAFWVMYGRVGPKKVARACWDKAVKKADPDVILDGLERWVVYWQTPGAANVKWPQGWLNEERWNDEPPQSRPSVSKGTAALMEIVKNRSAQ